MDALLDQQISDRRALARAQDRKARFVEEVRRERVSKLADRRELEAATMRALHNGDPEDLEYCSNDC